MTIPRFLQIHTLHSYPAALLNRDDSGLAKRMPFGDAVRTRISSQCLKRHWRTAKDEFAIHSIAGATEAYRSRNVIDRAVIAPLKERGGYDSDVLDAIGGALNNGVYGGENRTESGRQPLLLGLPEVEYLQGKAAAIAEKHAADTKAAWEATAQLFIGRGSEASNFQAFRQAAALPGGLEGALFGRMVTSDPGANIEAAVHVAHAFTVHREESESDYFSVVDDLQRPNEDPGAAHIGDTELTAGLFYGYVVVDAPGLISNLEGCPAEDWQSADREMAGAVVRNLIHLIATVSPGAKLGSTAPYGYAELMLVEAGRRQPRSLANAYREPVKARLDAAVRGMADHLEKLDNCYGGQEVRRVMSTEDCRIPQAERLDLDALAEWAADSVRSDEAA